MHGLANRFRVFIDVLQWSALLLVVICTSAQAQEPILELQYEPHSQSWTRSALLQHPAVKEIRVYSAAYGREITMKALAITSLLPELSKISSVQFTALDGFVANISGQALSGQGQAYLAIETQQQPWPPLVENNPAKTESAGPFYLVWLNPKKAKISDEMWPYQVVKIAVEAPLQLRFPEINPQHRSAPILNGLAVYLKNCAVCHAINGGGDARVGPDLNLPFNPTEYFQSAYLRRLIRQPASVRTWKDSRMPSFNREAISDADLAHLVLYLKQMAKQRGK